MTPRAKLVLQASAAWSIWVWSVLIRNMIKDRTHARSFRLAHIGLGVVSLAFAGATLAVARGARRRPVA